MSYTPKFNLAIGFILPHEAVYLRGHWGDMRFVTTENVAGDSGGLTKWGIDQASHPHLNIASLTYDDALGKVYFPEWQECGCEQLPERLAVAQFDVRVNGGHATTWLQLAMNQAARVHPRLEMDGVMGPATISAAQNLNEDQERLVIAFFIRQRDLRFQILARSPARSKFLAGWLQRDRDLEKYLGVRA